MKPTMRTTVGRIRITLTGKDSPLMAQIDEMIREVDDE